MGGCASTHRQIPPSRSVLVLPSGNKQKAAGSLPPEPLPPRRPEVVKVICEDGRVEEFKPPLTASQVATSLGGGGGYLCSWESMYVDACAPEVAEEEQLKAGQVYFVMPKSKSKQPLSLHEMCALAIKASSGLSLHDFHSSFRH